MKTIPDLSTLLPLTNGALDLAAGSVPGVQLSDQLSQLANGFPIHVRDAVRTIEDDAVCIRGKASLLHLPGLPVLLKVKPVDDEWEVTTVFTTDGLGGSSPLALAALCQQLGVPNPPALDVHEVTLVSNKAGDFSLAATMAQAPGWTLDLGPVPLTLSDVELAVSKPKGEKASSSFSGSLALGDALNLAMECDTTGALSLEAPLPTVTLSQLLRKFSSQAVPLPGGFDPTFTDGLVLIQRDSEQLVFRFATVMSSLGTVVFEGRRVNSTWGAVAGISLGAKKVSGLPGLSSLKKFEDIFQLQELVVVVSSFDDEKFVFPDLTLFDSPTLSAGKLQLPAAGGILKGLNVSAKWQLDTSNKDQRLLRMFLGLQPTLAVVLQVGANPAKNSRLYVGYDTTVKGMAISCIFGGQLTDGQVSLFLTGTLRVAIQGQPVRFDVTMLFVPNGAFLAGSMIGSVEIPFLHLKLSNLALAVGISAEAIPSVGFAATLSVDSFQSSLAVFLDSTDPSKSMLAGSVSDLTLHDVVTTLAQTSVPAEVKQVLEQVALEGTSDIFLDSSLATALDNRDLATVATMLAGQGIRMPSTPEQTLLVIGQQGSTWFLTDMTTMLHYELVKQATKVRLRLNPQLYFAPQTTKIGALEFQQAFYINGKLKILAFEAMVKILVMPSKGIAVEGYMSPIIIGNANLFSIQADTDSAKGPRISLATFSQAAPTQAAVTPTPVATPSSAAAPSSAGLPVPTAAPTTPQAPGTPKPAGAPVTAGPTVPPSGPLPGMPYGAPTMPYNGPGMPGMPYGAPTMPYNGPGMPGMPYGTPGMPYNGPSAPYGTPGMPYGAPGMNYGAPGMPYGAPGMNYGAPGMPYSSTPGMPYGAPGMPYSNPNMPGMNYGAPGMPYGAPGMPYGAPGMPYGNPNMPYGSPNPPYGAPNAPYGNPNMPYGAPGMPAPVAPTPVVSTPASSVPAPPQPQGQKPHFTLDGRLTLLGMQRGVAINIDSSGATFSLTGGILPGVTADLRGKFTSQASMSVGGSFNVGLGSLDLGVLGTVNISTGVQGSLDLGADSTHIWATFKGGVQFGGQSLTLPAVSLDVKTSSLLDLPKKLMELVKTALQDIFKDVEKWAKYVMQGVVTGVRDIGAVLHQWYHQTAEQMAKTLKQAGYVINDVTRTIQVYYNYGANAAAQTLRTAGYVADEVSNALRLNYNATAAQAASALNGAGYEMVVVVNAVKNGFALGANGLASALKGAGYRLFEVSSIVQTHFKLDAAGVASALKGGGYVANEVSGALRYSYGATVSGVASALKSANYSLNEVATALKSSDYVVAQVGAGLKDGYGAAASGVASGLKGAGYAVDEVGSFVQSSFQLGQQDVANALKGAGYSLQETGSFLQRSFRLNADQLRSVLAGAGYAKDQINGFFTSLGGSFADNARNAANTVATGATNAANTVANGVTGAANTVGNAFKKLF